MINSATKNQLKKLIKRDRDFCLAPTANNSMEEMCRRHPGEWPPSLAARALLLTDQEYKAVYVEAATKIREILAVDTDEPIV